MFSRTTIFLENAKTPKKHKNRPANYDQQSGFQDTDGNPAYALSSFLGVNPGRDFIASAGVVSYSYFEKYSGSPRFVK